MPQFGASLTDNSRVVFYDCNILVRLSFNLSNRVTDTLESSSILIYLETRKSIYTWG